jgi:hypothetical protein
VSFGGFHASAFAHEAATQELENLYRSQSAVLADISILLGLLGLGDHARPYSPHLVMVDEIIPAVERLVKERGL